MYPASVQILLSQFPLGKKMVIMASSELTASSAQPPEHSTALVCKHNTIQTLSIVALHSFCIITLQYGYITLLLLVFQWYYRASHGQLDHWLVWEMQPVLQWKLKMAENFIGGFFFLLPFSTNAASRKPPALWMNPVTHRTDSAPLLSGKNTHIIRTSTFIAYIFLACPPLPLRSVFPDVVFISNFICASCFYGDADDLCHLHNQSACLYLLLFLMGMYLCASL